MLQAARFAFGRNQIIPAARGRARRLEAEDAVGQRIAHVVVEEQPAVQLLVAEFLLNCGEVHRRNPKCTEAGAGRFRRKLGAGYSPIETGDAGQPF